VRIAINNQVIEVPEGISIAGLIERLGLNPRFVAVERNLDLIPRERHFECILSDGDKLEIVTLVGGG
jgi:sulfur carrier protein